MNTLIENRERASRKRERFCKRLNKTIVLNKNDQDKTEDVTLTPMRESITKLDSTIAYLNSEIASCQQVLMTYDEEQQSNELIHGPDPQFIVDCVTDTDELRYLLTKLIEQTIEKVRVFLSENQNVGNDRGFFCRVLKRMKQMN
jgi:Trm5-related predicted tRNA methylase